MSAIAEVKIEKVSLYYEDKTIHGWNFLGDITKEHLEYERIALDKTLTDDPTYQKAKGMVDKKLNESAQGKSQIEQTLAFVKSSDERCIALLF